MAQDREALFYDGVWETKYFERVLETLLALEACRRANNVANKWVHENTVKRERRRYNPSSRKSAWKTDIRCDLTSKPNRPFYRGRTGRASVNTSEENARCSWGHGRDLTSGGSLKRSSPRSEGACRRFNTHGGSRRKR